MAKPKTKPVRDPKEPNWHSAASVSGAGGEAIPYPYIYRFPNDKGVRRDVKIDISTWKGTGAIGATHYYAEVTPEANSIWDAQAQAWRTDTHHPLMKERTFKADVFTRADAIKFIRLVVDNFCAGPEFRYQMQYGVPDGPDQQAAFDGNLEAILRILAVDD